MNSRVKGLIVISAVLASTNLTAAASRGYLFSGQDIDLTPMDGYALSVTRQGRYRDEDTFDLVMSNKGEIFYNAPEQSDDIYLVFHDDVKPGDKIHIHVNHGTFYYKFEPIRALPKLVKSALSSEVLNKKPKKSKPKTHKRKIKKRVKEQIKENIPKSSSNIAKTVQPKRSSMIQAKETPKSSASTTASTHERAVVTPTPSPISESLFEKFTKVFKELFSTKERSKTGERTTVKREKIAQTKPKVITEKKEPKTTPKPTQKIAKEPKKSLEDIIGEFDTRELEHEATIIQNSFAQLPPELVKPTKRSEKVVTKQKETRPKEAPKKVVKEVNKPIIDQKAQKVAVAHEELEKSVESLPIVTPPKPQTPQKEVVISKPVAVAASTPQPPKIKEQKVIITDTTEVKVKDATTQEDKFAGRVLGPVVKEEPVKEYVDTSYKDRYQELSPRQESSAKVETDEDKIVITKIIKSKKEQEDKFAGRVLGPTSDRVLGNGYNPNAGTGKMVVRATRNDMPVSAWVEVFKNNTKQRVKTFYTSTSKAKSVRLPAGTYMIRATYRTRDNKIQTTIKNIRLKEGGKINKLIAFHDGTLALKATREGKPLYVKVEAYKAGSNDRVTYDFSSRNTGLARLILNEGVYDIRVYDYDNVKRFNGVRISRGQTQTLDVSF